MDGIFDTHFIRLYSTFLYLQLWVAVVKSRKYREYKMHSWTPNWVQVDGILLIYIASFNLKTSQFSILTISTAAKI